MSWWQRLLFPCVGGVVAGCVLQLGARWARLGGYTEYLEVIAVGQRRVDPRSTLVRSLSSMISVATGASIGREGAMVQVSTAAGHALTVVARLDAEEYRLLVACAAAAGLATAYNAPLASALFIGEIALASQALPRLIPVLLASITGNAVAQATFGSAPIFASVALDAGTLFAAPAWLLVGVAAGLCAPLFLRLLRSTRAAFNRLPSAWSLRLGLGGLLVGLISVAEPRVWGNGYSVIDSLLHQPLALLVLVQLLMLKALATGITAGSGAVGGVFTPTLLLGACVGQVAAMVLAGLGLGSAGAATAYAALGMGALLAATTLAPMMAILMVLEMTGQQSLTLPLAAACVASYLVARWTRSPSIYAEALHSEPRDAA